jgi:hypothetical protein
MILKSLVQLSIVSGELRLNPCVGRRYENRCLHLSNRRFSLANFHRRKRTGGGRTPAAMHRPTLLWFCAFRLLLGSVIMDCGPFHLTHSVGVCVGVRCVVVAWLWLLLAVSVL